MAEALGVTPAQVVLRRHVQLGALPIPIPIPKSADLGRQRDNLDVFGFQLGPAQTAAVSDHARTRLGGDPEVHEEF